jgi:2-dehydropantoate 2-reductase
MRLAVLVSGGIGGYYGALLAKGAHDVAFIARGAQLEALQQRGLTVRNPEGESTIPVTFQNGVDNVEAIAAVVGSGAVLAGAVYIALQLAGPGVVLRTGGEGKIVFGELSGCLTKRVQRIARAFQESGVPHQVSTARSPRKEREDPSTPRFEALTP